MANLKTKKINIKDAKPNMILAEDVVNKMGITILPKNTMLSASNYKKLELSGAKSIMIFEKEDENNFKQEVLNENEKHLDIEDRKEFKEFKKDYDQKIEKVETVKIKKKE